MKSIIFVLFVLMCGCSGEESENKIKVETMELYVYKSELTGRIYKFKQSKENLWMLYSENYIGRTEEKFLNINGERINLTELEKLISYSADNLFRCSECSNVLHKDKLVHEYENGMMCDSCRTTRVEELNSKLKSLSK